MDYLDDVSTFYVDLDDFGDPNDPQAALAMAMSDKSYLYGQLEADGLSEYTSLAIIPYTNESGDFTYSRFAGYGNPGGRGALANVRGDGGKQNDVYIVTNITLTYILGGNFVRGAKFR